MAAPPLTTAKRSSAANDAACVPRTVAALAARYRRVRAATGALVADLAPEDLALQSMPEASPGKWHLAHTTWFFEAMVLVAKLGHTWYHNEWRALFNSYYDSLGRHIDRPARGLLSRPTLAEVIAYRQAIDRAVLDAIDQPAPDADVIATIELGIEHEQQHQELLVADIKHLLYQNPLRPAWRHVPEAAAPEGAPGLHLLVFATARLEQIGAGSAGFSFDNERPRHRVWLEPCTLASRPVTNGEYRAFIEDGGYTDSRWWLSDGWDAVRAHGWNTPLYWERDRRGWTTFTVYGTQPLAEHEPVCHLSHYEADAYARWSKARLPTEAEWEAGLTTRQWNGEFADSGRLHPSTLSALSFGGNVWEWTASAYEPYPGYRRLPGPAGEYNGKFMSGQMVLRGGSCATPRDHVRPSYRNFFAPHARWQFSGLRLARNLT